MIVICVIVTVIGSFIYALLKVRIKRLEDSSVMKQSRLSLIRRSPVKCNQVQATYNDPIQISDDDSLDLEPNAMADTPNSVAHASECCTKRVFNISDDLSSEEDIFIPGNTFEDAYKSQSLFKWSKPAVFADDPLYKKVLPESSGSKKKTFTETNRFNKRQKLTDSASTFDSNISDELIDLDASQEDNLPEVSIQHEFLIAGVKVKIPVEPYKCQKTLIDCLISGCTKEEHRLLESPTGSGKTLALLCGALAWQEHYSESSCCDNDKPVDDNFFLNASQCVNKDICDKTSVTNKSRKVPKIYYGTRTHKQIKQVVREFKKTAYRHKRMTILSSRELTCIQKTVKNKNKNDLCHELLDPLKGRKCEYYNEHSKRKMRAFWYMKTPWDIEDLVSLGKEKRTCPYFGARSLMGDADIIFCPYNYLLDPYIRESMQIDLKGDIVILDEAHNIEDICRSAASVSFGDYEITSAAEECQNLIKKNCETYIYETIGTYLKNFVELLQHIPIEQNHNDSEKVSRTWFAMEFQELLNVHNVGSSTFFTFLNASNAAIRDFTMNGREETSPEEMKPTITRDAKRILEYLCFAVSRVIQVNNPSNSHNSETSNSASEKYAHDYRMYVEETVKEIKTTKHGYITTKKADVRIMKLICMNPAVVFEPLTRTVRSVIVASGTLAPTTSFQSELGTEFKKIVSLDHIIPSNQIYVRCISQGPNKKPLSAVYKQVNTWDFQDELGELVLQVCDAVPHGVLCFFSSYKTMDNIHKRWKSSNMWEKLSKLKEIFIEPKTNEELKQTMDEYHEVIKESSSEGRCATSGAILFAVCRGKIAEGIDFSDNEARCVIAVGIPYFFKNSCIKMKMEYNDWNKSKGLLSGSEWYTIDAFRAVNQAIGRCVRHKNDWGAVLLIDERYQQPTNINYLPKWIKKNIKSYSDYDLEIELQDFVALQIAREKG
ncbi:hypothetical protein PUN28_018269 [Cardiocondyla obscurior]|uniref:DNA 5'-3' helicase n=1 Tax=Cardiocondyla obscurior TaxID=286306 RepID=A0AAW2EKE2_9HYME